MRFLLSRGLLASCYLNPSPLIRYWCMKKFKIYIGGIVQCKSELKKYHFPKGNHQHFIALLNVLILSSCLLSNIFGLVCKLLPYRNMFYPQKYFTRHMAHSTSTWLETMVLFRNDYTKLTAAFWTTTKQNLGASNHVGDFLWGESKGIFISISEITSVQFKTSGKPFDIN